MSLADETALTIPQAAKRVPRLKGRTKAGRDHVNPSTVIRWAKTGVEVGGQRVRLEVRRCGGCYLTSVEALDRFQAAMNPATDEPPARTPAQRTKDSAAADRQLAEAGW